MRYSEFLEANKISNDEISHLLQTNCNTKDEQDRLRILWGTAVAKVNPPDWVAAKLAEARRDFKEDQFPYLSPEMVVSFMICNKDYPDIDAMFLAVRDGCWAFQEGVDDPNMELTYEAESL